MRPQTPVPQMSLAEFKAALERHGFRVVRAKIEDGTGKCPGVRWSAVLRGPTIEYNKTLAKVIAARNAELARLGIEEPRAPRKVVIERIVSLKRSVVSLEAGRHRCSWAEIKTAPPIKKVLTAKKRCTSCASVGSIQN